MSGGHYATTSTISAGAVILAAALKDAIDAVDEAVYARIGGGSTAVPTIDINGGTIDGAVIGGTSEAAGTFAALTATGDVTIINSGSGALLTERGYGGAPVWRGTLYGGSLASPSAVTQFADLSVLQFAGYDGSGEYVAARIYAQTTEVFGGSAGGANVYVEVTPTGSKTMAVALTIHNDKRLEIDGTLDHDGALAGFRGVDPAAMPDMGTWSGLTDAQRITALRDALYTQGLATYA